jgi:hypothetical protein
MTTELTQKEKILADVDDEIWLLMKRIQLKHNLSWAKARDATNESLSMLCGTCWNEMRKYSGRKI